MAKPNLIDRILRGKDPSRFERRRGCPGVDMVSGYVDSILDDARREGLQRHLADCAYCRKLVGDAVKLQRVAELPEVPAALIERVRSHMPATHERSRWGWMPVAAAGTLACTALAVTFLRPPPTLTIPTWPPPAGPTIYKSGPRGFSAAPSAAISETIRKSRSYEYLPSVTSPRPDSVVPPGQLQFRWSEVPDAVNYQVRVVTTEGDLVWEGHANVAQVDLPDGFTLNNGKYFVLVTALMENGRMRKSTPVRFRIASPR